MNFKNRLIDAFLGGVIETKVKERLQAASVTDKDEAGWRRLTGNSTKELPSVTRDRAMEIAYWLWKNNPLANWIIEITTGFVVADGFTVEAKNKTVKALLDRFWKHPVNNFPIYLEKYVRELGIYGAQCWPKFVSQNAGAVALGYIDPSNIKEVRTDPENVKIVIGVITKGIGFDDERRYKTALPTETEEFLSPKAKAFRDSCNEECFYFAINNVTNDPYGTSDLFVIADWLDAYEQFLFDYGDKWPLLNTFVWDLLVEGGDDNAIKEQIKNFTKKSGSVFGHNEKVKLTASTPDLKAIDAKEGARLFRNHILGSKSLPEHWYGGGGDVNLATSKEMSAPTFKLFSSRQKLIVHILTVVLDEVIREADAHGMLKGVPEEERHYTFNIPELSTKDVTKFATAIQQLSTSLVSAVTNEWIDKDTAVQAFAFCLSFIGYELDVDAVQGKMKEAEAIKGAEDYVPKVPTVGADAGAYTK